MALTLSEAAKLSNDILLQGVIEETIYDSPVLQYLPFIEVVGNALTYNRENTVPTIDFYDVGDTWSESTPDFSQVTATLKIMGGDADVDNYIRGTRSNIQDIEAAVIALKAKALAHKFDNMFLYGDTDVDAKQFNGIRDIIDLTTPGSQVITMGASGATLTLAKIDELIDKVKGGTPNLLLMSKRSRRKINALARAAGTNLTVRQGMLGQFVQEYNGIPIGVTDWQLDTHAVGSSKESATTGGSNSVIYGLRFGEGALCGITGPGGVNVERIGQLETKDATRTRIKWYTSICLFSTVSVAALIGVQD
jgi:hypothetical protein